MGGSSMAIHRWNMDPWLYRDRVFVGHVLDVGGTGDSIGRYRDDLTNITKVSVLDLLPCVNAGTDEWLQGDAAEVAGEYDCIYSSHCLEHVHEPERTVKAWWAHLKVGGHLVIIVPSWFTYEREVWPPRFNTDHKTSWVMHGQPYPHSRGILDLTLPLPHATLLRALTLDKGFVKGEVDQTASGECESGYEVVVRKDRA